MQVSTYKLGSPVQIDGAASYGMGLRDCCNLDWEENREGVLGAP